MKKKKLNKKLSFKKVTISNLKREEMAVVYGGVNNCTIRVGTCIFQDTIWQPAPPGEDTMDMTCS